MRGHWHFIAIAVAISFLTIIFHTFWFSAGLLIWLFYLYYNERLGKLHVLLSLAFFLFFYMYIPEINNVTIADFPKETIHLSGKITGPINASSKKADFKFEDTSNTSFLIIYFPDEKEQNSINDYPAIKYGAACTIKGDVEVPEKSRNPGQFDYQTYLLTKGISYQVIVESLDDISCTGTSLLNRIFTIKDNLQTHIKENVSTETAAWLNALVLGDDTHLDEDIVELFQRWSLSHILAISGLHVGLVVAFVYFFLIRLNLATKEKAEWLMILFLPVYAVIAGGEPSVWRAATMVLLFIVIRKMKLKFNVTDVLSVVFLLLILFDKYIVYHIGFQLSFMVTFGLLLSRELISKTDSSILKILHISFVAQLMILPLQLAYFYTFQPLSIILNVLAVPYFSLFVIPFMFLILILSPFPIIVNVLDPLFVLIHQLALHIIQVIDMSVNHPFIIGPLPVVSAVLFYVLYYKFMNRLQKENSVQAFLYGLGIAALVISMAIRPYFSPEGRVTMLDIGQGDAIVIELPYREGVIFIDAGSQFSFENKQPSDGVYKQIIRPYLHSRGIGHVDHLFLTHEDIDHTGSAAALVKEFNVGKITLSSFYAVSEELSTVLVNNGTELQRVVRNDRVIIGTQIFHVVAPYKNKLSANENSLVLFTNLGGNNWLFTGDIGKSEEKELIRIFPDLSVDILKIAHHGSNTSTDELFINQIKPFYGLISVGKNNMFGHPAPEVTGTLEEEEVQILRTDVNGAIQFQYKGDNGTFFTFLP